MSEEFAQVHKSLIIQSIKGQVPQEFIVLVKKIVHGYRANNDLIGLYMFFNDVHDFLYHDLLSKKVRLEKKTLRVLEHLATPFHERSSKEQELIFDKVMKLK